VRSRRLPPSRLWASPGSPRPPPATSRRARPPPAPSRRAFAGLLKSQQSAERPYALVDRQSRATVFVQVSGGLAGGAAGPRNAANHVRVDYDYVWADGIHVNIRLEEARLCLLVLIGPRGRRQEFITLADGYRESTESWADRLRDAAGVGWVPRCSPSGTGRWGSGVPARGFPRQQGAAVLVPQGRQRPRCHAEVRAARRTRRRTGTWHSGGQSARLRRVGPGARDDRFLPRARPPADSRLPRRHL